MERLCYAEDTALIPSDTGQFVPTHPNMGNFVINIHSTPEEVYAANADWVKSHETFITPTDDPERLGVTDRDIMRGIIEHLEQYCPIDEAKHRPMLAEAIKDVAELHDDPLLKEALNHYGSILDWVIFGKEGDTLPPSLVIVNYEGQLMIRPTPESQLSETELFNLHLYMTRKSEGYREVYSASINGDPSHHTIKEGVEDLVRSTPTYAFLKSFDVQQPVANGQRPLSWQEKANREALIIRQIRDNLGLQSHEHIQAHSPAHLAIAAAVYELDQATVIDKKPAASKPPAEKLKRRHQDCVEEIVGEKINSVTYSPEDRGDPIRFLTASGNITNRSTFIKGAEQLLNALERRTGYVYLTERQLEQNLVEKLLTRLYRGETDYTGALSAAITEVASPVIQFYTTVQTSHSIALFSQHYLESLGRVRQPVGRVMANEAYWNIYDVNPRAIFRRNINSLALPETSTVVEGEQIANLEKISVAKVLAKNPHSNKCCRLIESVSREKDLSRSCGEYDIAIEFGNGTFGHGQQPNIPGYVTVACDNNTYYFRVLPDQDPYQKTDIPITFGQLQTLANHYKSLGLDTLASATMKLPDGFTVDKLAKHIALNGLYPTAANIDGNILLNGTRGVNDLVHEGQLIMQCSGASIFLEDSLKTIFSNIQTRSISGYILKPKTNEVNAVKHRQVLLIYQGRHYILDATPSKQIGNKKISQEAAFGTNRPSIKSRLKNIFKLSRTAKPPRVKAADTMQQVNAAPTEAAEPSVESLLNAATIPSELEAEEQAVNKFLVARHGLEEQLGVIYDQPNRQGVYSLVSKLSDGDPVKKTLKAVMSAAKPEWTNDDTLNLLKYLNLYQKSPASKRQELRLPDYDNNVINALKHSAQQLL